MQNLKLCRMCLTQPIVSHSLLESDAANMLQSLTSIKINSEDGFSKRACVKCWLNLKLAYRIQQTIIECDKKLRSLYTEVEVIDKHTEVENISRNIKEEQIEVPCKIEPEYNDLDCENSDVDTSELSNVKLENLTETDLLVLCPMENTTESSDSVKSKVNEITTCHICGTRIEENVLIDHLKIHYFSRLQCDECNTYCENIASYKKHISLNHKEMQNSFTCTECTSCFHYKPLYNIHTEHAHKEKVLYRTKDSIFGKSLLQEYKYRCSYCKRKFKTEEENLSHMKSHSKKECPECGKKITPSNFRAHLERHSSVPVVCHLCGITYKNSTSLRSHIHYTHSTRKYSCKYCNKVFKKGYDLPIHIKKHHTGQKDHVCDICGKGFFTFHYLNNHKKMTHLKLRPFKCQYCKKPFSSKHALRTHERQHTNITPYSCEICGEGFRQNVSLRSHKKSKHNIVEDKSFPCSVCGKKFVSEWAVLSHMRVH